ncbi:MAG: hypothetical protein ABIF11_00305 [Nitrospirota bacterium]
MIRLLINDFKKRVCNQKGILPLAIYPMIGAGMAALGATGAATSGAKDWWNPGTWFGGGKKKGADINYYDPEAAKRQALYNQLSELLLQEEPKIFERGKQFYQQELVPGIQEMYQAKRGLGPGSTPEISALGRAGSDLSRQLAENAANLRLRAAQMQAGLLPEPLTTVEQPQASLFQNLLSFAAPLASSYIGGGQQAQLLRSLFGNTSGSSIAPQFNPFSQNRYDLYAGLGGY